MNIVNKKIIKFFNNPLGRLFLGVPKGKKIYKITKYSTHYYTGERTEDGRSIICSGFNSSVKQESFQQWLKNWKPIHLCWFFKLMDWKIPKYLIGADTGALSPGTASGWSDPDNIKASDNQYATASGNNNTISGELKATNFNCSVPVGATIVGIYAEIERKATQYGSSRLVKDNTVSIIKADGSTGTENKAKTSTWQTETYIGYGGASDLWSETWSVADINDADFGFLLKAALDFASTGGEYTVAYVDHMRITIYYSAPPSLTTEAATILSLNSCTANGTITSTGGDNATIRGFAYKSGTSGNPTTADNEVHEDGDWGAEAYDLPITGLNSSKSWRIAAYATNPTGTAYGSSVQLTLPAIKKVGDIPWS